MRVIVRFMGVQSEVILDLHQNCLLTGMIIETTPANATTRFKRNLEYYFLFILKMKIYFKCAIFTNEIELSSTSQAIFHVDI